MAELANEFSWSRSRDASFHECRRRYFYQYYGDSFKVEGPPGSGKMMNLYQVSTEIADRLTSIFLRGKDGNRPVYGGTEKFQADPHWRDHILFYEYFHGDNGAGVGASHQTGWTGAVARLLHMFATTTAEQVLQLGTLATIVETKSDWADRLDVQASE